MNLKRKLYWSTLGVVGAATVALKCWSFVLLLEAAPTWMPRFRGVHPGPLMVLPVAFGALFLALVGIALVLWYRQTRRPAVDPVGELALEYVEGRVDREGYFGRKAILEEGL